MPMISVLGKMFLWQREGPGGRWTCQTSRRVASDPAWAVEWIELPRGLSLSSLGSARTLRGWSRSSRPSSVDSQDLPEGRSCAECWHGWRRPGGVRGGRESEPGNTQQVLLLPHPARGYWRHPGGPVNQVNVGDTVAMLPKSRRALTIQEIAALARSSLHGISQVVKDHVTKPTAMAQGRVAHLIEWKGWSKPSDSPAALESAFSSYSDLSEGEQEARFAAGVAEQFAIAEAKLRAWSSVDGEDSTDESYDEDFVGGTDSDMAGQLPLGPHLQDLFSGHRFSRPLRQGSVEPESDCSQTVSPDTLCSSLCSLEDGLLGSPARLASQLLGEELLLAKLPPSRESAFRSLGPLEAQDSLYNSPLTESRLSAAEEEPAPCEDCQPLCPPPVGSWEQQQQASAVASSGVVSLDEDEAEPEEQ
ncbi:protein FAM131A isoform X1 [Artibeus jamaicensis]|uniref:protein FAM131A isoform X1 n=1 Tax=Artibeus jamaicensis TaxID=9417 RepID=UPI00235A88A0|nr:protein FAM131A isoform X1 [Artibeus jamaicensis]XP_053513838.1 protein FAM131A isoform X1 [Artibeus jamaicensis]